MWLAINLLLAFYIVPAVASYILMQLLHKHLWPGISPEPMDIVLVLFPFVNIVGAIHMFCLLMSHFHKKKKKEKGQKVRTFSQVFFRWREKE